MGIENGDNHTAAFHIARIAAEAGFNHILAASSDSK